ncbi:Uncharacterised protein [Vibrio cholerae]|nr:Uncharacterised protein [Vibrio cholerae]CSA73951.1 Uncharacterised protein [Vibrio cholerae]CSB42951.1 Uncharacterised protein [Vibrio cholerae]CSB43821.1 Uncharacterised protein [Vibrio cholerae]CSC35411.1 Uncharacterised protein [Vibrio cholerae]
MRKRLKTQLINGIGGVRNQLTQENFFVGVQRVNHQVQQLFNFRLKTTRFFISGCSLAHNRSVYFCFKQLIH